MNISLRLTDEEKTLLDQLVSGAKMTVSDYIKYRVFVNNPDCSKESVVYETPSIDKRNYHTMVRISYTLSLLMNFIREQKGAEEFSVFNEYCRQQAKERTEELGYNKVVLNDG